MKEIIKEIIEFDLDEGRMDYLDDMIDVFSKDGCEMVDILFDRFLKKYYADIDVSNERMTINLTDEEGHVLSFNLSQSEVHYVLHMVERRLNSFMRDDGGPSAAARHRPHGCAAGQGPRCAAAYARPATGRKATRAAR